MNPKVDAFINSAEKWKSEFIRLRQIVNECGLTEELKWGVPCYTSGGKNVILIHGFKEYCAVLFVKGALLKDSRGILITQTENVQSSRQIRFTNLQEVNAIESDLKAYIREAVEVEKSGLKVAFKPVADFNMPDELVAKFNEIPALKLAFNALTPGRQRAYLLFFSSPKLSNTRAARVEKSIPQILAGKGLND